MCCAQDYKWFGNAPLSELSYFYHEFQQFRNKDSVISFSENLNRFLKTPQDLFG